MLVALFLSVFFSDFLDYISYFFLPQLSIEAVRIIIRARSNTDFHWWNYKKIIGTSPREHDALDDSPTVLEHKRRSKEQELFIVT